MIFVCLDKIFFEHIIPTFPTSPKLCKKGGQLLKPWHMGTHSRVLSDCYPINTNMTGFRWFSKLFASLCLWTHLALALEGLIIKGIPHYDGLADVMAYAWYISRHCTVFLSLAAPVDTVVTKKLPVLTPEEVNKLSPAVRKELAMLKRKVKKGQMTEEGLYLKENPSLLPPRLVNQNTLLP